MLFMEINHVATVKQGRVAIDSPECEPGYHYLCFPDRQPDEQQLRLTELDLDNLLEVLWVRKLGDDGAFEKVIRWAERRQKRIEQNVPF